LAKVAFIENTSSTASFTAHLTMAIISRQDATALPDGTPLHEQSAQKELLALSCTLTTVALIVVAGRSYVRAHVIKAFKLDDWLMLLAAV
jgi:hypothetical protein